jgi:hypothetical protein
MRLLLVMCLALGLAPGLGEVVESAHHLSTAGHLAHTDAGHGDFSDQGTEHGCGTTEHHCVCCASQVAATAPVVTVVGPATIAPGLVPLGERFASLDAPAPPYRPPIAS